MSERPKQLPLDWPHAPSYAREDFLVAAANSEALRRVESWPEWPSRTMLLVGPVGSGKSHLGAIWAERSQATRISGEGLAQANAPVLADAPALLIDDADHVGAGEAEFFHLLNLTRESGTWLLMTARAAPDLWGLATPDLVSRLRLAPIVRLDAPDAEFLRAALMKLFADRQIAVDAALVAYLAARLERSLEAAQRVVAELDREALARGRPVTRALAAEILRDRDEG